MTKKRGHSPDYIFLSCLVLIVIFGLVMLSSASSDLGKIKFNDTYYYLKHQISIGLGLGILGFIFAYFVSYQWWKKIALPLLFLSLIGLVLVFTPLGFSHSNANRWINIGSFSVQPAEFLKLTFIVYLAAWLSLRKGADMHRQTNFLSGLLPFWIISGLIGFLILIQPSTTTVVIILSSGLIVYFASGAKLSFILGTALLAFTILALVVFLSNDYRAQRIETYVKNIFNQETVAGDVGEGYHINQALMSIGSGGIFGVGFGKSTTKFEYLPEPIGDSIFAVIAEELGFVGASGMLAVFIVLITRGFLIAKKTRDKFARLVVVGVMSVIAIQAFVHIGAISGIIPLTGVSLPFISYGGTSLAVFLTMTGLVVKISKYT